MTVMPRYYNPTIWFIAFLLLIFSAGCGDPDKTGTNPGTTPPTVLSVTPSDGVCPDTTVTATFSEAMNPATIDTTTFTLTGPGGASVAGTVTYDVPSRVATFTQTSPPLLVSTTYTATITTGALDLMGVPLATDKAWSFTTSATACPGTIPLGTACGAGILAGSTVTNTGPSNVTGDVDVSPGTAITGFSNTGGPGTITGAYHAGDSTAAQAQLDLTTAYLYAAGLPPGTSLPGDMSGLTFTPGVWTNASSVMLSAGNVTLDALGDANAVFVFQIGSTLTTITGTQVVLAGGAQAKNIFWQVGSSATLGTSSTFYGTIMAQASITLTTGATLNGRALARTGAVTLDSNPVNVSPCP
jgi:Ice-binding-like/Bacterial Ig-like domain